MAAGAAISVFLVQRMGIVSSTQRKYRVWRARRLRLKSEAVFVAVTGSSSKSTTVALLDHILSGQGPVITLVLQNMFRDVYRTLIRARGFRGHVVLETGVGGKGQMEPMARMIVPDLAIVTMIALEHYSAFKNREAIAAEKGELIKAVRPGGFVLLNADDDFAQVMAAKTKERVVTFGREKPADYRVVETSMPQGRLQITLQCRDGVPLTLRTQFVAEHFWLATAAAAAAALELGLPRSVIAERTGSFEGLPTRCQPYPTKKGPLFILDSAKAPLGSLNLAFKMMEQTPGQTKRIVLGHLSDYSGNPKKKYRDAYKAAREVSSQVVFVGDKSHYSGATAEDKASSRFKGFSTVKAAHEYLRSSAGEGEVILVKSSSNLHLERIALAWDHDVKCWVDQCGRKEDCMTCGLYGYPYEQHRKMKRAKRRRRLVRRLTAGLFGS